MMSRSLLLTGLVWATFSSLLCAQQRTLFTYADMLMLDRMSGEEE